MFNELKENFIEKINQSKNLAELEIAYRDYLGRKGKLTEILRSLKDLSEKEKKEKGRAANQIKQEINQLFEDKKEEIQSNEQKTKNKEWIDITAPGKKSPQGHLHPISIIRREIEEIFQSMGFSVIEGPEVENEYYNFDALNIPQNHPARDVWDTFWLKNKMLLRTHTSPMQIRYMEKNNPPLRIIVPGKVFRHERTDSSHDVQFYQVEGLMVGKDVSVANFKGLTEEFFKRFFGPQVEMRLRSSYFPFTEPSFEVDIKRKGSQWLEILGAGMVHPNVLKAVGYNPKEWQGFAFGMGVDRLAMIKYQIDDIRLFYNGDLRFLEQF